MSIDTNKSYWIRETASKDYLTADGTAVQLSPLKPDDKTQQVRIA